MTDVDADVIGLLVPLEANFMTATKKGQRAVTGDTLRLLAHNKSADTLDFGVSDDSLQCLLAGTAPITGAKTFTQNLTIEKASGAGEVIIKGASSQTAILKLQPDAGGTASKNWDITIDNTGALALSVDSNSMLDLTVAGLGTFNRNLTVTNKEFPSKTTTMTVEGESNKPVYLWLKPNAGATEAHNWSISANGGTLSFNTTSLTVFFFDVNGVANFYRDVIFYSDLTVNKTTSTKALCLTQKETGGDGYIDAATARSNEIDISDTGMVTINPSGVNNNYFAISNKIDGQMIMFVNLSGTEGYIDNDETGGIYLVSNNTVYARWDAADDTWYYGGENG